MMNAMQTTLYASIRDFPLDEGTGPLTFLRKLAKENGWKLPYAERVIEEYKKFVFLGVMAGHATSPSDVVDQAWHLHMVYTRSYWNRFCPEILGKPFHHEPARGGPEEQERLSDDYARTLESYRRFFGQEAPGDIWPPERVRPDGSSRHERIDRARHLILPWSGIKKVLLLFLAAGLGVSLFVLATPATIEGFWRILNLPGPEFLGFYWLTFSVIAAAGLLFRSSQRRPSSDPGGEDPKLDVYQVAYLCGGKRQALQAAVAGLAGKGALSVLPMTRTFSQNHALEEGAHPLEQRIHQAAGPDPGKSALDLGYAALGILEEIAERARSLNLVLPLHREVLGRLVPVLAVLSLVPLGIAKVGVGLSRHRPVELLVASLIVSTVGGVIFFARRLHVTHRGQRVLNRLKSQSSELLAKPGEAQAGMTSLEIPMAVALFGTGALIGSFLGQVKEALSHLPASASGGGGDGGGSGCGGGGCGGGGCGGGGCGGCA